MDYLVELISNGIQTIAEGDAGFLTVLGMGCVFLALITLTLFMTFMDRVVNFLSIAAHLPGRAMGRLMNLSKFRSGEGKARWGNGEYTSVLDTAEEDEAAGPDVVRGQQGRNEEIAAAISVALSLHSGGMAPSLSIALPSAARAVSPWRMAGRFNQLQRAPKR